MAMSRTSRERSVASPHRAIESASDADQDGQGLGPAAAPTPVTRIGTEVVPADTDFSDIGSRLRQYPHPGTSTKRDALLCRYHQQFVVGPSSRR